MAFAISSLSNGLSYDENVVYLGFEQAELADLSLMVFGEGLFQIETRADVQNGGKGKLLDTSTTAGSNILNRKIRFERWSNSYFVGFQNPCSR